MKTFILAFLALCACAAASSGVAPWEREGVPIHPRDPLDNKGKKAVKNVLKQMPCGWPEYGIPPVAPYTNENLEYHVTRSFVDSLVQMVRFRLDGLNEMDIRKMVIHYAFKKKVQYHFYYKELKATAATINTKTFVDLLKEYGVSVEYEGSGPFEFSIQDINIHGKFKYEMPWFFGSIKIKNFECYVTVGSVRANIGALLGNGRFNEMINEKIEYMIPQYINGHQNEISSQIEQFVVPHVNDEMKGKKIWWMLGGGSSSKCHPEPPPW